MRLKQVKILLWVLLAVTLLVLIVGALTNVPFALLSFVPLTAYVWVYFQRWRSPHCGGHLGRIDAGGTYCPHCGKKLDGLE